MTKIPNDSSSGSNDLELHVILFELQ